MRAGFDPKIILVEFVVDEVALGKVLLPEIRISL